MNLFATTLLLMLDEIALMVDRIANPPSLAAVETGADTDSPASGAARASSRAEYDRELHVVWAVAKGSARSKVVLVVAALLISAFATWALLPLLVLGGLYLCYEGASKITPRALADGHGAPQPRTAHGTQGTSAAAAEQTTIRAALRTDFVLSAEIIVVALFEVADETLAAQATALAAVAAFATVGVYSVVAGCLRLDDAAGYLIRRQGDGPFGRHQRWFGGVLSSFAPHFLRTLAVLGTIAAFLIGGEILTLAIPGAEVQIDHLSGRFAEIPVLGSALGWVMASLLNIVVGVVAGVLTVAAVLIARRVVARMGWSSDRAAKA